MKFNRDFISKFQILKGGKISLVTTALLLGIATCNLKAVTYDDLSGQTVTINANDVPNPGDDIRLIHTLTQTFTIANDVNINSISAIRLDFAANTTIINNGTIQGSNYGVRSMMDHGTSFTNNGTITSENGYAFRLEDTSFVNGVNGVVNGTIENWFGLVTNNGLISLSNNNNISRTNDFTNENTGTLRINLLTNGTLQGTSYSQLQTTNATFAAGSTIDVNVLNSSTNVGLLAGNRLADVVTSSGTLTDNGLVVTDNSALLNFQKVVIEGANGKIDLDVIQAQTVSEAVTKISPKAAPTQYANSQGAAKALDKIIDNMDNNPKMDAVITKLNQLSSNEKVAIAVESTTPVATNATVSATTQISTGISGIVTQRQNANINSTNGVGANSGDGMFSENNLWIKPFGSIGSQNDKDGINGFDLKTYGLALGADTEYKDNQRVGLGLFYTNANVDVNNMNQNADIDVYTAVIYGNVPVIDDKTNFLYQAGYSWQQTATDRTILLTNKIAEAEYTSNTASLDLKLMRDVSINKDLLIQPLVNTTYRHLTSPEYKETGAESLSLKVDKFNTTELIVGLGTLAHYKLDSESKIIGNVNVGYDLHDKASIVTSSYAGASSVNFVTDGIDNGRWSYEAGIGYERDINKTNNINVSYDYQAEGKDFSNNVISAKYVLKF